MTIDFGLAGKRVFVFGGTSGINLGIATAFADAGCRLAVASRNQEKVAAAVAALSRGEEPPLGYALEVRDAAAVAAAIADFREKRGTIDVLISGADIDLLGTFHVMRAAHAHLTKPGASIVNISAPQAFIPMAFQVHVCAAKAGVDMVTKTLAIEWGPEGVRVNSVVPGPIDGTEGMARLAPNEASRKAVVRSVPMRRMGTPDDIAQACLFLASDAARYVSGAILPVDGAWSAAGASIGMK
jgi:NAD(P)-dependent dehydrogenase (short-subunit alcohol dehydrogenase family)